MRETNFIKQNKEKWQELEQLMDQPQQQNPEKLHRLFVQITDDLSYSRTYYPNRSVRVYLNGLAQNIFKRLYKTRQEGWSKVKFFWMDELPMVIYNARAEFRFALAIFVIALLIGAVSSAMDPEFPRVILGDDYVDMTIENIEKGDPMNVYKDDAAFGMSVGIVGNNVRVALQTFLMGVFFAVGTVAIMIYNGIMVGAFQFFFYERGVFWESFLTIWMHGALEISAIVIAGAAGLTMGRGLVFPGTYSRIQAFQLSARRGLKIMMGVIPMLIVAGFIEGYLTRHTEVPDLFRGLFILTCFAFVGFYFVWYPMQKAKSDFLAAKLSFELPPDQDNQINFKIIKSVGMIFSDVFKFYRNHFGQIAKYGVLLATVVSAFLYWFSTESIQETIQVSTWWGDSIETIQQFFYNEYVILLPLLNVFCFSLVGFYCARLLLKEWPDYSNERKKSALFYWLQSLFPIGLLMLAMITPFSLAIIVLFAPLLLLWQYIIFAEQLNMGRALQRTFFLIRSNYGKGIGLTAIITIIGLTLYILFDSGLMWFYIDVVSWSLGFQGDAKAEIIALLGVFSSSFALFIMAPLYFVGMGIFYHTLVEINEAPDMMERIQQIGKKRYIRGLETEG